MDFFSPIGHHFLNLHTDLYRNDEAQTCSRADVATARSTRPTATAIAKVANYRGTTHLRCAAQKFQIHSRTRDISPLRNFSDLIFSRRKSLLTPVVFLGVLDVLPVLLGYIRKVRIPATYPHLQIELKPSIVIISSVFPPPKV